MFEFIDVESESSTSSDSEWLQLLFSQLFLSSFLCHDLNLIFYVLNNT